MPSTLHPATEYFLESNMDQPRLMEVAHRHVVTFSRTCPGKVEPNDDSAAVICLSCDAIVMAVADGVGGAPMGYRASAIAMQCLGESLNKQCAVNEGGDLRPAILDGIEKANAEILDMGTGAATTISVVEVQNGIARGYQVGDSMSLIVGGRGVVKWKSTSHSPVGYLIESGMIEEADAMNHDDRHIVSNLVGSRRMHIEIGPAITLAARDTIVLASDGLFDNLHVHEICQIARQGRPLARMEKLVALATERMNGDDEAMPGKPDDFAAVLMTP